MTRAKNSAISFSKSAAVAAIILATVSLAGCTINLGAKDTDETTGATHNHSMMSNDSNFSGADIMFAQMMIPHHQQAVDMGTLAETRASSADVKFLAARIKAEQAPEIMQMQAWLDAANAPMEMDHEMGMGGMLDDAQMTALKNAKGAEFDRLFLEGMIGHHKGAIHMAQMVIDSNNAEAAALGKVIIDSQTKQISYMESLLAK